jgi:hypothetical protein
VIVDHVSKRTDREVEGNGDDESDYAGAKVFVDERVFWSQWFEVSDDETRMTRVGVCCSYTEL